MKVAIDLDDVLFPTGWMTARIWQDAGYGTPDLSLYNFGDTEKMNLVLRALFDGKEGGWLSAEYGAVDCIKDAPCEVHFVTSRPVHLWAKTANNLKAIGLFVKPMLWVIGSDDKVDFCFGEGFDFMIDDSPAVIAKANMLRHGYCVRYDRPWNRMFDSHIPSVTCWDDVRELLNERCAVDDAA